jgi:hypothetical protein
MTYATTRNTTTLYTIGQRSSESRSYTQVVSVVDDRAARGRLEHYGITPRAASDLLRQASDAAHAALARLRESAPSASAELALPSVVHGDMIDSADAPHGESFRIIATVVCAPGVPVS